MLVYLAMFVAAASLAAPAQVSSRIPAARPALPSFPMGDSALPTSAWPASSWPAWLRARIKQEFNCLPCSGLTVEHVDLGRLGPAALLSRFEDTGGQGGNSNTFAIVYHREGHDITFEFGSAGSSKGYIVRGKGPIPDLVSTQDEPCCSAIATRYSFSKNSFVESGCNALEFDQALWDMKHVTIKPCTF